jgi:hypothetical protein
MFNKTWAMIVGAGLSLGASFFTGCGPKTTFEQPATSPPRGTYDPSAGCQQALSHVLDLAIKTTGQGPTNSQRGEILRRCVEIGSDRGSHCVLALQRLPGQRGGLVGLGPVWTCFQP